MRTIAESFQSSEQGTTSTLQLIKYLFCVLLVGASALQFVFLDFNQQQGVMTVQGKKSNASHVRLLEKQKTLYDFSNATGPAYEPNASHVKQEQQETLYDFSNATDPAYPPNGYPWQDGFGIDLLLLHKNNKELEASNTNSSNNNEHAPSSLLHEVWLDKIQDMAIKSKHNESLGVELLYVIQNNGTLYGLNNQLTHHEVANYRGRYFQEMVVHALQLAKQHAHRSVRLKRFLELQQQQQHFAIPFILVWGDGCSCVGGGDKNIYPRMAFCRLRDASHEPCHVFAVPGYDSWTRAIDGTRADMAARTARYDEEYPWSNKLRRVVWRGSSTGPRVKHWHDLPRAKMVQWAANSNNTHADIRFTNIIDDGLEMKEEMKEQQKEEMKEQLGIAERIEMKDMMKYIGIVDIDGNAWSERYPALLCYNSVVLKVQTDLVEYISASSEVSPWVHYVPIKDDLSNLEEAIEWVMEQPQERLETMASAARDWCITKSTKHDLAVDMLWILVSYFELLRDDVLLKQTTTTTTTTSSDHNLQQLLFEQLVPIQ